MCRLALWKCVWGVWVACVESIEALLHPRARERSRVAECGEGVWARRLLCVCV